MISDLQSPLKLESEWRLIESSLSLKNVIVSFSNFTASSHLDSRDLQINIVVGENVLLICILYSDYEKDRTLKEKKHFIFIVNFQIPRRFHTSGDFRM